MARKSISKSIRLSEDLMEYIMHSPGDGFNDKFERLICSARDDEPRRKEELKRLDETIRMRQKQLDDISAKVSGLSIHLQAIFRLDKLISETKKQLSDLFNDS